MTKFTVKIVLTALVCSSVMTNVEARIFKTNSKLQKIFQPRKYQQNQVNAQVHAAQAAAVAQQAQATANQQTQLNNSNAMNGIQGAMARARQGEQLNQMLQVPVQYKRPENRAMPQGGVFGRNVRKVSHYQAPVQEQVRTGRVAVSGASFMNRGSRSVQVAKAAAVQPGRSVNQSLLNSMNSQGAIASTAHAQAQQQQIQMQKRPMAIPRKQIGVLQPGLRAAPMLANRYKLNDMKLGKSLELNNNFSQISGKLQAVQAKSLVRQPASLSASALPQVRYAQPQIQVAPARAPVKMQSAPRAQSLNSSF